MKRIFVWKSKKINKLFTQYCDEIKVQVLSFGLVARSRVFSSNNLQFRIGNYTFSQKVENLPLISLFKSITTSIKSILKCQYKYQKNFKYHFRYQNYVIVREEWLYESFFLELKKLNKRFYIFEAKTKFLKLSEMLFESFFDVSKKMLRLDPAENVTK